MNDPEFMRCGAVANETIRFMATRLGTTIEVEDFASEEGLNAIVDRLTAMGIRAMREHRRKIGLE